MSFGAACMVILVIHALLIPPEATKTPSGQKAGT